METIALDGRWMIEASRAHIGINYSEPISRLATPANAIASRRFGVIVHTHYRQPQEILGNRHPSGLQFRDERATLHPSQVSCVPKFELDNIFWLP
jgi:hypothetical protein